MSSPSFWKNNRLLLLVTVAIALGLSLVASQSSMQGAVVTNNILVAGKIDTLANVINPKAPKETFIQGKPTAFIFALTNKSTVTFSIPRTLTYKVLPAYADNFTMTGLRTTDNRTNADQNSLKPGESVGIIIDGAFTKSGPQVSVGFEPVFTKQYAEGGITGWIYSVTAAPADPTTQNSGIKIKSITFSPPNPTVDTPVTYAFITIKNGNKAVPAGQFTLSFKDDGLLEQGTSSVTHDRYSVFPDPNADIDVMGKSLDALRSEQEVTIPVRLDFHESVGTCGDGGYSRNDDPCSRMRGPRTYSYSVGIVHSVDAIAYSILSSVAPLDSAHASVTVTDTPLTGDVVCKAENVKKMFTKDAVFKIHFTLWNKTNKTMERINGYTWKYAVTNPIVRESELDDYRMEIFSLDSQTPFRINREPLNDVRSLEVMEKYEATTSEKMKALIDGYKKNLTVAYTITAVMHNAGVADVQLTIIDPKGNPVPMNTCIAHIELQK